MESRPRPEILAPAGDEECFFAALAAGADAVYLGLKRFSARMEARNFGMAELARLVELAHSHGRRVHVAMNGLIKPDEIGQAWRVVKRLTAEIAPDGLIIQDLGLADLARQAGFSGLLAFSALANVSFAGALPQAAALGASRVILPRELSVDEIRKMDEACPPGLELECFVHGALCYCVSGRCYWSSLLGGKSGLRGRCVQPCRRLYSRRPAARSRSQAHGERFFACQDLRLGPLVKTLLSMPNIASWKIEGRKKSPHYVYHTVTAYRILRDEGENPRSRAMALELLDMALGRPGAGARFLPQRAGAPMAPKAQTSSGLFVGKTTINQDGSPAFRPRLALAPGDRLRVGVEDEPWHSVIPVRRAAPKGSSFILPLPRHKTPKAGASVFLIDRRDPELKKILADWKRRLEKIPPRILKAETGSLAPIKARAAARWPDMRVSRGLGDRRGKGGWIKGVWLAPRLAESVSGPMASRLAFWLPPDAWPENESALARAINRLWRAGARSFVCNAPWQRAFFPASLPKDARLIAGPFCNIANGAAIGALAREGFQAAFASPELPRGDALALPRQSGLPLGFVIGGFWPAGISRFGLAEIAEGEPFASPKGEEFWSAAHGGSIWIYPAWPLNLEPMRQELLDAGYSFFAFLDEPLPKGARAAERPGLFNWNGRLL